MAIALGGCNAVLGLDATQIGDPPPNADGDMFLDVDDNCPTVANDDQSDLDQDGLGDACDTCRDLFDPTNHDEDRDGRGDLCDDCPLVPDFPSDLDSDGVGDACEPVVNFATKSSLAVFDGFATLDRTRWIERGAPWQLGDDAIAPTTTDLADRGLHAPDVKVGGGYFEIDLGVFAAKEWSDTDRFGIYLVDDNGIVASRCEVTCTTDKCALQEALGTETRTATLLGARPIANLRFVMVDFGVLYDLRCSIDNLAMSMPQTIPKDTPMGAGTLVIVAAGQISITYVGAWNHL